MIRAASEIRLRCHNHPHRRATRQCARCKRGLCDACVPSGSAQPICDTCRAELEELERISHVPPRERLRRFGVSVRSALIGLAILSLLAIPGSYLVRNLMSTPITPEEFARFRYAATGTFETQEGVNALTTVLGARILSATSEQPEYPARRLIDEYVGPAFPGWRSADATFPQEVVMQTGQPARVEKLYFVLPEEEPPETWAREVEVLVSTRSADGPYQSLGHYVLERTSEPQRFLLERSVDAHWITLRMLSNRGGPYVSLAEFNAYSLPRGPFATRTEATPPRSP